MKKYMLVGPICGLILGLALCAYEGRVRPIEKVSSSSSEELRGDLIKRGLAYLHRDEMRELARDRKGGM